MARLSCVIVRSVQETEDDPVFSWAFDEDEVKLTAHVSESPAEARFDMGIASDMKRATYSERYPEGYVIQWWFNGERQEEVTVT